MNDLLDSLKDYRKEDWEYESGRVFSSMCSNPLEKAWKAYEVFKDTNALDHDIFPSVKNLERKVVKKVGELFSHPEAGGYVGSGGTEGNMVALWLARELYEGNKVIAPKSVHYSVEKACELEQMKLKKTELDENYRASIENTKEKVDQETSVIIATAGTTALGLVDPIKELAEIAEDYDCFLHVDASFGGFVLPFLENTPDWDFDVDQVSSITADPDKMGLAPIPAGTMLVREKNWLNKIQINAPYLRETKPTLLGTRPGASATAVWAALNELGYQGYQEMIHNCMENTTRLADGIKKIDEVNLIVEPELNIVSFNSELKSPEKIYQDLKERNWLVSLNTQPKSIRLVIMPHHKSEHINSFLKELEKYMEETT